MEFPAGLGTALITPFLSDMAIDYVSLDKLLDTQIDSAVDYIVVLGTTGEPATLSAGERDELLHHIVRYVAGRKPLVLGLGGNNTAVVCQQLKDLAESDLCKEFAAILSVCPYYNKPNQEGLYRHFVAIAKASPIPVLLYNVPGRTGVNLLPETVIRIHEACPEKVIGIKEASGNEEQVSEIIRLAKASPVATTHPLAVISGDDGLCYQLMQLGAVGLISVLSNAYPKEVATLVHDHKAFIQAQYEDMIELLFREGSPVGVKELLRQRGVIATNTVRLPLAEASNALAEAIAAAQ